MHRDDYDKLVALLREVRKEAGITQVELAARLGVEQSMVSKVERRERRLDVAELRTYCSAMGITLIEFVSRYEAALPYSTQETTNGGE